MHLKEGSQSAAQARTGTVQMAGKGGVDQIGVIDKPCQLPGLLGFQSHTDSWYYTRAGRFPSFCPPEGCGRELDGTYCLHWLIFLSCGGLIGPAF